MEWTEFNSAEKSVCIKSDFIVEFVWLTAKCLSFGQNEEE